MDSICDQCSVVVNSEEINSCDCGFTLCNECQAKHTTNGCPE